MHNVQEVKEKKSCPFLTRLKSRVSRAGLMKFAPDRLRRLASGKPLDVPFEKIVEGMCAMYGYQKVPFVHAHNFEKEINYDDYEEESTEVTLKNVLIEEKPKKKSKNAHVFKFDDDIDDMFEEFFNEIEENAPTPSPLNNRRTQIKDEDLDNFFDILEGGSLAAPSPGTIAKGAPKECAVESDDGIFNEFFQEDKKEEQKKPVSVRFASVIITGELAAPKDPNETEEIDFDEWFDF